LGDSGASLSQVGDRQRLVLSERGGAWPSESRCRGYLSVSFGASLPCEAELEKRFAADYDALTQHLQWRRTDEVQIFGLESYPLCVPGRSSDLLGSRITAAYSQNNEPIWSSTSPLLCWMVAFANRERRAKVECGVCWRAVTARPSNRALQLLEGVDAFRIGGSLELVGAPPLILACRAYRA